MQTYTDHDATSSQQTCGDMEQHAPDTTINNGGSSGTTVTTGAATLNGDDNENDDSATETRASRKRKYSPAKLARRQARIKYQWRARSDPDVPLR